MSDVIDLCSDNELQVPSNQATVSSVAMRLSSTANNKRDKEDRNKKMPANSNCKRKASPFTELKTCDNNSSNAAEEDDRKPAALDPFTSALKKKRVNKTDNT
eukprot:scaffold225587_cov41-Attheya_sp.AAC.2